MPRLLQHHSQHKLHVLAVDEGSDQAGGLLCSSPASEADRKPEDCEPDTLRFAPDPMCWAVCSRAKGFGFVEYMDPRDAEDALYGMDGKLFGSREIAVGWCNRPKVASAPASLSCHGQKGA